MTGSAIVTINAAAQAGARAAVGPARVGESSGAELVAGSAMLIGLAILLLVATRLIADVVRSGDKW